MSTGMTIIGIDSTLDLEFFKYWVDIMSPVHHLSPRDMELTASLLYRRYKLSKVISNDEVLDAVLLGTEERKQLRDEFWLSQQNFQVILSKLRAKKIIIDDRINSKFIPNIKDDTLDYKLTFHIRIKNDHGGET